MARKALSIICVLVIACGLAVVEGPFGGVFDLVVAPALRSQGYGSALLGDLLRWMQGVRRRRNDRCKKPTSL